MAEMFDGGDSRGGRDSEVHVPGLGFVHWAGILVFPHDTIYFFDAGSADERVLSPPFSAAASSPSMRRQTSHSEKGEEQGM